MSQSMVNGISIAIFIAVPIAIIAALWYVINRLLDESEVKHGYPVLAKSNLFLAGIADVFLLLAMFNTDTPDWFYAYLIIGSIFLIGLVLKNIFKTNIVVGILDTPIQLISSLIWIVGTILVIGQVSRWFDKHQVKA